MTTKHSKVKFVVKDTHKYGKGVYAAEDIKKGTVIRVFGGKRTTLSALVNRIISGKEFLDDPFQIGRRTYLDLDEICRTFNHSCDPSCGVRKRSELFALRDIKKGEELTYDYSLTIAPTEWEMKCKCGTAKCRKTLGDVLSVPKKRRDEYRKMGALQRYMKKLLDEIEKGGYKMPAYEKNALKKLKAAGKQ